MAQIADLSSQSKEERMKYDESIKQYRDALNVIEGALQEGKAKGRAAGLQEGRAAGLMEGILSSTRNMKSLGLSTDIIMQATGLTAEEIDAL